jgi:hypothetical protein
VVKSYPDFDVGLNFRNRRFTDARKGLEAFAKDIGSGIERSGPILSKELRKFLDEVVDSLAQRHGKPFPSGTSPGGLGGFTTLSKRSGGLLQSIRDSVRVTSGASIDKVVGSIGGSFLAGVHERGATIRPVSAQYLTVPLPGALNANGKTKRSSARQWDNTFVAKSKNGNLIIFRRVGREITPLYVLKEQVTIPPRLGMGQTIKTGLNSFVDEAIDAILQKILGPGARA